MADVQVAVGLGREAGDDLGVLPAAEILADDLADEVAALRRGWLGAHGAEDSMPPSEVLAARSGQHAVQKPA